MTDQETPNQQAVNAAADALNDIINEVVGGEVARLRDGINYRSIGNNQGILYSGATPNRNTEVEINANANLKNNNFIAEIATNEGRITAGRADRLR